MGLNYNARVHSRKGQEMVASPTPALGSLGVRLLLMLLLLLLLLALAALLPLPLPCLLLLHSYPLLMAPGQGQLRQRASLSLPGRRRLQHLRGVSRKRVRRRVRAALLCSACAPGEARHHAQRTQPCGPQPRDTHVRWRRWRRCRSRRCAVVGHPGVGGVVAAAHRPRGRGARARVAHLPVGHRRSACS